MTAVGGTVGGGAIGTEGAVSLSSGGFSLRYDRPSWQKDAVEHYLKTAKLPDAKYINSTKGRGFPDISAQAMSFVIVTNKVPLPGVSGTSCASPTAAGVFGLLNDARLVAERALACVGTHFTEGQRIWELQRSFEIGILEALGSEDNMQSLRVRHCFLTQIATPGRGTESAWEAYKSWEREAAMIDSVQHQFEKCASKNAGHEEQEKDRGENQGGEKGRRGQQPKTPTRTAAGAAADNQPKQGKDEERRQARTRGEERDMQGGNGYSR